MFNSVYTNVTEDITSDINNIDLFFNSKKGELFGDPHFGTLIHSFLFDQNGVILKEVLLNEIYEEIRQYLPQLIIDRKNIDIKQIRDRLYLTLNCSINGAPPNLYTIELMDAARQKV